MIKLLIAEEVRKEAIRKQLIEEESEWTKVLDPKTAMILRLEQQFKADVQEALKILNQEEDVIAELCGDTGCKEYFVKDIILDDRL
jgi:hypothetical protein